MEPVKGQASAFTASDEEWLEARQGKKKKGKGKLKPSKQLPVLCSSDTDSLDLVNKFDVFSDEENLSEREDVEQGAQKRLGSPLRSTQVKKRLSR